MNYESRKIPKCAVLVDITLADGSVLCGNLFASGRITDVLNDDRRFLPVETDEGKVIAIAKSGILKVAQRYSEPLAYQGSDPWRILGVEEGISGEELKQAYRQLCHVHHPDRIRGLGLGSDYQKLATRNMARINEAYAQLVKSMAGKVSA